MIKDPVNIWTNSRGNVKIRKSAGKYRMMKKDRSKLFRILIGVLLPAALIFACFYARSGSTAIGCVFYQLTGLYCPGCGSTRAIRALMNGQLKQAFWFNPLLFVLGPPSFAVLIYEYLRYVFPKLRLKPLILPWQLESAVTALIIVYWILRNIPAFSVLAP